VTATFLVRAQVKTRIAEILGNASGVPVYRAFPPDVPDELIWLASTMGGLEYNVLGTNLPRDDKFSVVVVCMCFKPGDSPEEAEARVEEIASTVIVELADNVRLDDETSDEFSIFDALITSVDGPDAMPGPDGEGWDAFVRLTIDIHLRITREQ
jgi:hypothetical protein